MSGNSKNWRVFTAPTFHEPSTSWRVYEKDSMGQLVKTHEFISRTLAAEFIKKEIVKDKNNNKKEDSLTKEITKSNFLTSALDSLGDIPAPKVDEQDSTIEDMIDEKKTEILKNYNRKKEEFKNTSVNLIKEIADLYFDAKLIKKHSLIAFKKEMESSDISSILMQHDIAEQAVYRLHETIELGAATNRTYEVLAGMQKFVLELTLAKRKFMKEMEEDLRALNDEILMKESETSVSKNSVDASVNGNQKALTQNINFIVHAAMEEMGVYLSAPSKNPKLRRPGDLEIQEAEIVSSDVPANNLSMKKGGLDSFDED